MGKIDEIFVKQFDYDPSNPTSLTITDLIPNQAYYFDIFTYVRSNSSMYTSQNVKAR